MTDHKLELGDASEAVHSGAEAILRSPYKVEAEAGLFKNGKHVKQGEIIELDAKTAAAFEAAGDVSSVEGEAE